MLHQFCQGERNHERGQEYGWQFHPGGCTPLRDEERAGGSLRRLQGQCLLQGSRPGKEPQQRCRCQARALTHSRDMQLRAAPLLLAYARTAGLVDIAQRGAAEIVDF